MILPWSYKNNLDINNFNLLCLNYFFNSPRLVSQKFAKINTHTGADMPHTGADMQRS
jgi:hypothetical protein